MTKDVSVPLFSSWLIFISFWGHFFFDLIRVTVLLRVYSFKHGKYLISQPTRNIRLRWNHFIKFEHTVTVVWYQYFHFSFDLDVEQCEMTLLSRLPFSESLTNGVR